MTNLVITDVYCYLNKGDAGIVIAMVDQLKEKFDNPNIKIVSLYPSLDKEKYGSDVEIISPSVSVSESKSGLFKVVRNFLRFLCMLIRIMFHLYDPMLEAFSKADLIISCGGGYMQSFGVKHFLTDFIYHYSQLYAARLLGKRYVIFAQTVGPFDSRTKKRIRPIIENASLVLTREPISYKFVNDNFNCKKNILTSDVAFLLKPDNIDYQIDANKINVGVTIRDWGFPGKTNREYLRKKYIESIISFINNTLKTNDNIIFYFMPQCIGPNTDNDLLIMDEISSRLSDSRVHFVREDLTPGQLKGLYGQMSFFIGMRMHSNIFALGVDVPCLAISYDRKTDGIMQLFNMANYVVSVEKIDETTLSHVFKDLMNDFSIRKRIEKKRIEIESEASKNFDLLVDLVGEK